MGEEGVSWKIRKVKSLWGCCHWRDRYITYNAELARAPRDLVEYVVAHEYTHFAVHGHGPMFYTLMDGLADPSAAAQRARVGREAPGCARTALCRAGAGPRANGSHRQLLAILPRLWRKLAQKGAKLTFVQTEFRE